MPAKKTLLNKLAGALNATSPRKRMLLFVLVFAIIGGGVYLYTSHAATAKPPLSLTNQTGIGNVVATDGVKAQLFCNYLTAYTGYGKMTACTQIYPGSTSWVAGRTKFRAGSYNLNTRKFYPSGSWLPYNSTMSTLVPCAGTGYYFSSSNVVLNTGYGPITNGVMFRQVYSSSGYVWQGAFVNYSTITKRCTTPGAWFNVYVGLIY